MTLRDERLARSRFQLGDDAPIVAAPLDVLVEVLDPDDRDPLAARPLDQPPDPADHGVALVGLADDVVLHIDDEQGGVGPGIERGQALNLASEAKSGVPPHCESRQADR